MAFDEFIASPIVVDVKSVDKNKALRQLAQTLCKNLDIRGQKQILDKLQAREESSSTFIGQGVAMPQSQAPIDVPFAIVVGRSVAGVQYDAARGALAHVIILVVSKPDVDENEKLSLLSKIASFFKSDDIQEQILSVDGPFDVVKLIRSYMGKGRDERRRAARSIDSVIESAVALAREIKAARLFVFADAVRENDFLDKIKLRNRVIVVASNKSRFDAEDKRLEAVINAPPFPSSRIGQIKVGILLALSRNLIRKDARVVCLAGNSKTGMFDTVVVLDIAREYEFFFADTKDLLPPDIKPEVLERVLGFASEVATEGREGKPTGTIFVVGDTNSVSAYVRQLIINPFRGYSEAERSVLDPGLDETIKEFTAIDGAFVITGDGIVVSAGSYLRPQTPEVEMLPSGFGSRHAAAAGITACTNALAITVSESTGMVTLFKSGSIMLTLSKPVIQDKERMLRMM